MERVGTEKANVVRTYINDAYQEMEGLIPEQTTHVKYSIVADQKYYDPPSDYIRVLGMYQKATTNNNQFVKIGRVTHISIFEPVDGSSVVAGEDVIII
jgi:hypothetical protein